MFTIDMLPAQRGDSLWIEYGNARKPRRILIDGGILATGKHIRARIENLAPDNRRFELLIISHIDLDHIAGIVKLFADPPEGLEFGNVWFNGWKQLLTAEEIADQAGILGPKLGERLSARIDQRKYPWNEGFDDALVAIRNQDEPLPHAALAGGMKITLLSPTVQRLRKLRPVWEDEIREAGLEPGAAGRKLEGIGHPDDADDGGLLGDDDIDIEGLANGTFSGDTSEANGSSIAVMAEFDGKRCALLGDAYAPDVAKAIDRILANEGSDDILEVAATKLSHHGGRKNTSAALLKKLHCRKYLVSTDGSSYHHPHSESLSRVVVHGAEAGKPSLIFNYRSKETEAWDVEALFNGDHPFEPVYPDADQGISVDV